MGIFTNKFYTLDRILDIGATYNLIIGERSNGKTYAGLKYGLEKYFKYGEQMAIVRRWKEDIRGSRASEIFSALTSNDEITKLSKGKYEGIYYWAGKFYPCNYDDDGKAIYSDSEIVAYPFALSDTEHNKSVSYPNITTILFDEFITRQIYLPDEFVLFMNTVSTIVRQRTNVKILMLGNTVNKYCPYFDEMGLKNVNKQEQGTIDIYKYGDTNLKVAVEYCKSLKKSKENNFYFAFDNPKLDMITSGAWELDIYPHCPVKYTPKHVVLNYFIEFSDEVFQAEIVQKDGAFFTYIHRKTTPIQDTNKDIIFNLDYNPNLNYNRSILQGGNKILNWIKWFFLNDRVYYQNNMVGDSIKAYIIESSKGVI